ncbi:hypothetical protein ACDT12_13675, partial [Staphylococcus aureus]
FGRLFLWFVLLFGQSILVISMIDQATLSYSEFHLVGHVGYEFMTAKYSSQNFGECDFGEFQAANSMNALLNTCTSAQTKL